MLILRPFRPADKIQLNRVKTKKRHINSCILLFVVWILLYGRMYVAAAAQANDIWKSAAKQENERECVCVRERVYEWLVDVLSRGTYEHTFHSAYYLAISQCSLCCCALCCVCTVHLLAPVKIPLYVTW